MSPREPVEGRAASLVAVGIGSRPGQLHRAGSQGPVTGLGHRARSVWHPRSRKPGTGLRARSGFVCAVEERCLKCVFKSKQVKCRTQTMWVRLCKEKTLWIHE